LEVELSIDRLAKTGEGIGTHLGRSVFVDGGLPGDRVRVEVAQKGPALRGHILSLLAAGDARRVPPCPLSDQCGGCDWLHFWEDRQRAEKLEIVLSALEHMGGVERGTIRVLPSLASQQQMAYRRRAVMHFSGNALCFFGRRSHRLIPIDRCPALTPALQDLPAKLSRLLMDLRQQVREVTLLAEGEETSFALFLKSRSSPRCRELCLRAIRQLGFRGAVLVPEEGAPEALGEPVLSSPCPGRPELKLYHRPDAFAQANAEGNAQLAQSILALLHPQSGERALELYCGNGNLTFALAHRVANVCAVEASSVSLELARRTAAEGRVQNVRFILGRADQICAGLVKERETFDILLADPPRPGARRLAVWAERLNVKKLLYIACDAASLARDAAALRAAAFSPSALQLIDMFPQTHHVEVALVFSSGTRPSVSLGEG
jgi:23S rRNA (uracil1939-C5)-methyltransferase